MLGTPWSGSFDELQAALASILWKEKTPFYLADETTWPCRTWGWLDATRGHQ